MLRHDRTRTNGGHPADKQPVTPRLVTSREASNIISVCPHTLRRWERAGRIKALRFNSRVKRYKLDEIQRLIQEAA
jgi:hypothetical protein